MPKTLAALAAVLLASLAASDKPASKTHAVTLNGHGFTLPVGFTIEPLAKPGLVDRPIAADFDDEGRLYVADSSGSNEKVAEQLAKKPHRIVRLEDSDGDGVFDKSTVFADRMMFPEGVMWLAGSVYVAAPPSIWKLTDTDGDGVADRRKEWFAGKTLTGCANDLHGPYAGPDGRIYWCKGAFAEQTHPRPGRKDLVTKASHIFRARVDGTAIEAVMTGGMDNPVDVVWTPAGERVFTTTFFQHPGGGLRDGLIHNVYGGVWGKEHAVLDNHPRTGPDLMPVLSHMGAAAPAGLHRYESASFGGEYRDNLFAAQFNMAMVSRHVLKPQGATFASTDEDFVVSSNRDFHPTDVTEDADGSLVVIDTGGWYKLCCPTSQLSKPDILGAIYRVRKIGAAKVADPWGKKVDWKAEAKELEKLLDDGRPAVRRRAVETLAARGHVAAVAGSVEARRNAVWLAARIDSDVARGAVRGALGDEDEGVRQAALHVVSLWRDVKAVPDLTKLLKSKSAHNQRAAAEALGRVEDKAAVAALFAAVDEPCDRWLEHSLVYALMEINEREAVEQGLQSKSPRVRRAALLALAGMDDSKLAASAVLGEVASPDERLKAAAWYIAGRNPAWGDDLAGHFEKRLAGAKALKEKESEELSEQLGRFAHSPAVQALMAAKLGGGEGEKRLVLRALAGARRFEAVPEKLHDPLLTALDSEAYEAALTLRQLPLGPKTPKLLAKLLAVASDEKRPTPTRLAALSAVPGSLGNLDEASFAFLCKYVDPERPVGERGPAAGALARAQLSEAQLTALAGVIRSAGPLEIEPLLEPFAKGKDEKVGLALLEALKASPSRAALHADRLRARLVSYPESVRKQGEALIGVLDADGEARKKQLDELVGLVKKGDVRQGQLVFNSQKAACASCHAIGYLGGKIGPDLTRIGKIRDERDLLESILFPSASFVRSYEPVQVTTLRGQVHNGLIKRDGADELLLTVGATEELRIAKKTIETVQPGKVSVMPGGLDKVLTARELADLTAFLKACQ